MSTSVNPVFKLQMLHNELRDISARCGIPFFIGYLDGFFVYRLNESHGDNESEISYVSPRHLSFTSLIDFICGLDCLISTLQKTKKLN